MTRKSDISLSRRGFLHALGTVSVLALLARFRNAPQTEFVEIDGWILKRSDLA